MKDTKQKWFKEAKFGLFIHFGLYAILAGEYKGKRTDSIAEWIMNDLNIPVEEYEKLIHQFNPEQFDPHQIVSKAKEWGMRYIVLTAKHHEGFALYNSAVSSYNVMNSPYGKDLLKELKEECDRQGMKMGLYYSQAQDWHDPDGYVARKDNSKKNFGRYLNQKCIPQLKELLMQYGDIGLIWFDTPMETTEEESREIVRTVKELQPACIVSGRIGNGLGEYMTTGDNFIPAVPFEGDWEVPATLNDTWGYSQFDHAWKNAEKLIRILLKINARGGNYLLNVGPKPDGSIPEESVEILDQVGKYVRENADSIFDTFRLPSYPYEIQEVLFTCKPHKLFAHVVEPIHKKNLEILNIDNTVKRAYITDTGEELEVEYGKSCEGDGYLNVRLPDDYREKKYYCVTIEYSEEKPIFSEIRDRD